MMNEEVRDAKQQWTHKHAERLLQHWLRRKGPVSVAPEYVRQLERDLSDLYEQPLTRAFIENTD